MPIVLVYEQKIKGYNPRLGRVTCRRDRFSFRPIPDFTEDDSGALPGEDSIDRVLWYGRGGETAIRVRIPFDAKFIPHAGERSYGGSVEWLRSPLVHSYHGQVKRLNPMEVLRIARSGLKAENGDTFQIREDVDVESVVAGRAFRDSGRVQSAGILDDIGLRQALPIAASFSSDHEAVEESTSGEAVCEDSRTQISEVAESLPRVARQADACLGGAKTDLPDVRSELEVVVPFSAFSLDAGDIAKPLISRPVATTPAIEPLPAPWFSPATSCLGSTSTKGVVAIADPSGMPNYLGTIPSATWSIPWILVVPQGSTIAGGSEAPSICTPGMTFAASVVEFFAKLGRYAVALREMPVEWFPTLEVAPSVGPYREEIRRTRTRSKSIDVPEQGRLFA